MNKKYDKSSFLAYINNPMSKESISILYDANNIKYDRCELYSDFVQSLLILLFDTYMGDEITDLDNQFKHFEWCWAKNVSNFKKEGIRIDNDRLYDYFLEFMFEVYYSGEKDDGVKTDNILKLWVSIFNYSNTKTNSDIDTLIEIYQLFENSFVTV